jgi:hypothetical protein
MVIDNVTTKSFLDEKKNKVTDIKYCNDYFSESFYIWPFKF